MFQGFGWDHLGVIWQVSAYFLGNCFIHWHFVCVINIYTIYKSSHFHLPGAHPIVDDVLLCTRSVSCRSPSAAECTPGYTAFGKTQTTANGYPPSRLAWPAMDMSYCKRECMWMGPGWWDMEPPRGGLFGMDSLMNLCRSTRIVMFSLA